VIANVHQGDRRHFLVVDLDGVVAVVDEEKPGAILVKDRFQIDQRIGRVRGWGRLQTAVVRNPSRNRRAGNLDESGWRAGI